MQPSATLADLETAVRACTRCRLHSTRTHAVPGTGPSPADVMIVGEAPGYHEDMQGRPFVGAAGKLLDRLLLRIGLSRETVYITNVLKCRPPENRDPLPDEAEACVPYLREQYRRLRPRAVVILGRHALERMLPGQGPISRVHGQIVMRGGVAFMPVDHPAAALHNGSLLRDLEADFDRVRGYLDDVLRPAPPAAPPAASDPGAERAPLLA